MNDLRNSASSEKRNGEMEKDSDLDHASLSMVPSSFDDFHRWQAHIALKSFGEGLHAAAQAIFPNESRPQYSKTYVLMLSWEDETPNQPISIEMGHLRNVLEDIYNFESEIWRIPNENSHLEITQKIQEFVSLGGDSSEHLKLIYYNGQARLDKTKELAWTRYDPCSTVVSTNTASHCLILAKTSKAEAELWNQDYQQSNGAEFKGL